MSKTTIATKARRTPPPQRASGAASTARAVKAAPISRVVTSVKAKTLRLEPEHEAGLSLLKGVLGMPINKMVNEAVADYIRKRTAEVETDLSSVLERIKAYRKSDPHFEQSWERFADAEARYGAQDPVEGVAVVGRPAANRRKPKSGSTRSMIRDMLKTGA